MLGLLEPLLGWLTSLVKSRRRLRLRTSFFGIK